MLESYWESKQKQNQTSQGTEEQKPKGMGGNCRGMGPRTVTSEEAADNLPDC